MSVNACFLHQLRHDVFAWRWRLGLYGALLLLSFPSLYLYQHSVDGFRVHEWNGFLLNAFPGAATLLAALSLAGLVESATPYDPEGFGRTRPARMGVVLSSRLLIFFAGFLLPWMLQQVLLCHTAVGTAPWQDLWIRLVTEMLPYAACFAFAVTLGSTARQKTALAFAALLFLYFTRLSICGWQSDGVFALMPDRAGFFINSPKQVFLNYSWSASLPQPERWVNYQLLVLLIGVISVAMAWGRFRRAVTVTFFVVAIVACGALMENVTRHQPLYLTPAQEQTSGLEKTAVKADKIKIKEMPLPKAGQYWQLEFRPTFEHLPPAAAAMLAADPAILTTPGRQTIEGTSELYHGTWPEDQDICHNTRLAPAFRRAVIGSETENLSLSKKWSADELYVNHVMRPFSMEFVPKGAAVEHLSAPFSVRGEMSLPLMEYYEVARGPFHPGLVCHGVDGLDVHLTKIIPRFRTARTSAGTMEQWSGVEARFWMSSLSFDHHADHHWTESGELILILYHPVRHEILADMGSWSMGNYLAGTPIRLDAQYERFWLDPSRIGTVDEHWLDQAEMILLRGRFAGTLKREIVLEGLKAEKSK